MTQSSEVRKIRLVRDESGQELLQVLVSHEPQPWINLLIVVSLVSVFCLGILSFFIIDQYTEIQDIKRKYDLNDTWVRTHRHEYAGAQATLPETEDSNSKGEDP